MVTRLKAISAVEQIVGDRIWPLLAPQDKPYPCIVYQITRDESENVASGPTKTFNIWIQINCIATGDSGTPGYTAVRTLADAILGDCDPTAPSGLAGWSDTEGHVWQYIEGADTPGSIVAGKDVYDAYVISQVYRTSFHLT